MWQYNYSGVDDSSSLSHYGVLGMKRGVRKDPKKALGKASKKLNKYGDRISKSRAKANKFYNKAEKKSYSFFSTEGGVARAFDKANKAQKNVNSLVYEGSKWFQAMEKEFAKQDVVSISDEDMALGKSLCQEAIDTSR